MLLDRDLCSVPSFVHPTCNAVRSRHNLFTFPRNEYCRKISAPGSVPSKHGCQQLSAHSPPGTNQCPGYFTSHHLHLITPFIFMCASGAALFQRWKVCEDLRPYECLFYISIFSPLVLQNLILGFPQGSSPSLYSP